MFTIKTCITPIEALTPEQRYGLIAALGEVSADMQVYHGGHTHHERAVEALSLI